MRICVSINNVSLLEKNISIATEVSDSHDDKTVKSGANCLIAIEGEEFKGVILSVRENETKKNILLHFPRIPANVDLVRKLYYVQYTKREFGLFVEEKADPGLYKDTETLLKVSSHLSGLSIPDTLMEITSFRPGIPGKRDLRYVSPKQMKVVRDKCEVRIGQIKEKNIRRRRLMKRHKYRNIIVIHGSVISDISSGKEGTFLVLTPKK